MSDVMDYQKEIWEWAKHNFRNESRVSITLGTAEEMGELCRAVLKQFQEIRGTHEEWDREIHKEIGDVFIKLCQLASFCGWDLDLIIENRWKEVKKRDWIKDKLGHGLPE